MRTGTFTFLEDILRDYPITDDYINKRQCQITYTADICDQGIASKTAKQLQKNMKLTTELDERLVQLRLNEACVAYCLAHTDQETLTIIDELYFKRHSALTLEGLGQQLHLSKSCISKRRAQFMMLLADQLGLSSSMSY